MFCLIYYTFFTLDYTTTKGRDLSWILVFYKCSFMLDKYLLPTFFVAYRFGVNVECRLIYLFTTSLPRNG